MHGSYLAPPFMIGAHNLTQCSANTNQVPTSDDWAAANLVSDT